MYWAITTMVTVGYGDISALNTDERMYCIVAQIISIGVYAYTINEIGKKVLTYNVASEHFRENMFYVSKWMQQHDLREDLRD